MEAAVAPSASALIELANCPSCMAIENCTARVSGSTLTPGRAADEAVCALSMRASSTFLREALRTARNFGRPCCERGRTRRARPAAPARRESEKAQGIRLPRLRSREPARGRQSFAKNAATQFGRTSIISRMCARAGETPAILSPSSSYTSSASAETDAQSRSFSTSHDRQPRLRACAHCTEYFDSSSAVYFYADAPYCSEVHRALAVTWAHQQRQEGAPAAGPSSGGDLTGVGLRSQLRFWS